MSCLCVPIALLDYSKLSDNVGFMCKDDASTEPAPEPSEPWGEAPTAGEVGIYKPHHGYENKLQTTNPDQTKIEWLQKDIAASRQSMLKVNLERAFHIFSPFSR